MTSFRLLVTEALDGAGNMALEAALRAVMERDLARGLDPELVLRLYAWSPACVSVGRHQALEAACDLEACEREGVDVVRRPTGGRAVLHDDEITHALLAPAAGPFAGPGVGPATALVARALASGLAGLGADVQVERGSRVVAPSLREACFTAASRCEVLAGGRKLGGSAQVRFRDVVLQHGSLPLRLDPARHGRLLRTPPDLLASRATDLETALGGRPDPARLREALVAGFEEALAAEARPSGLSDEEEAAWTLEIEALRADSSRWRAAVPDAA